MLIQDLRLAFRTLGAASGLHGDGDRDAGARTRRERRHVQRHPRRAAPAAAVSRARGAREDRRARSRDRRDREPVAGRLPRHRERDDDARADRRARLDRLLYGGRSERRPRTDWRRQRHRRVFPDAWRVLRARAAVRRRRGRAQRADDRRSQPRLLAAPLRRRFLGDRPRDHAQRTARDHRRRAGGELPSRRGESRARGRCLRPIWLCDHESESRRPLHPRGWPTEGGRDDRAGPRRARRHRDASRTAVPDREHQSWRRGGPPSSGDGGRDAAGAAPAGRRGWLRAAGRVRQPCQPAARAGCLATIGARGSRRDGSEPPAACPSAGDRERRALGTWRDRGSRARR